MTARAFEARYRQATITRGFWLGQTPVTQEAYQRVIGNNSSYLIGPRLPVETVSWDEAQAFLALLPQEPPRRTRYSPLDGPDGSVLGDSA